MPDLKLTSGGDLAIVDGDLVLTDDESGETVAQIVAIRLRLFYGEWFLDTRRGVKYFERVFVKNPDLTAIETMLRATILDTPGVVTLNSYTQALDRATRQLTVTYRATVDPGVDITQTEVLG